MISKIKDVTNIMKDIIIFGLLFMMVLLPNFFNKLLVNAGITHAQFGVFEWKDNVYKNNQILREARFTIGNLNHQIADNTKNLDSLVKNLKNKQTKEKISLINNENRKVVESTTNIIKSISNTIKSNSKLINDDEPTLSSSAYGVVYGGDISISSAQYEASVVAKKFNLPNVKIFFKDGYYRVVSVVNAKEDAKKVLIRAKKRRMDAYIVLMSSWCTDSKEENGFLHCLTNKN